MEAEEIAVVIVETCVRKKDDRQPRRQYLRKKIEKECENLKLLAAAILKDTIPLVDERVEADSIHFDT